MAVAELLAAEGAGVVVIGRGPDAVEAAAQRISGVGYAGSPSDPSVADALIETCINEFGRIDILVNCAGTAGLAGESILNVTSAQFHDLPARSHSSATTGAPAIRPGRVRSTAHRT